ncbi:MAG: protein kinase [Deltaproteobacteria bacterium]|nr:protein kinase [Deltaproteobacteria bacterium]
MALGGADDDRGPSDPDDANEPGGPARLPPGTVLAQRYGIMAFLGKGGMGTVYAARDYQLEDEVALKILHPRLAADSAYRQRLRSEVRLARRVSHPNVCRVHDIAQDGDKLFVTMERVKGDSLRQILRAVAAGEAAVPLARAIDLVVQLCSALAAAHRAGVLHRDVKPDNIVSEEHRAVLTDFGVAGLTTDPALGRLIAGTPAYIAPEVLRGEPFDARSDVFGAAVVAYELLAGRVPFPTRNLDDATRRASSRPKPLPLPATAASPAVRAALDKVLAHALDFDPLHRIGSADRLAEALATAARGGFGELRAAVRVDDEPTPTSAPSLAAPTPVTRPGPKRPELRVATVLVFRCLALGSERDRALAPDEDDGGDTRLVPLEVPGEDLERVIVDLGGTPIAVEALAITALFGAPTSLGDDAARAARAARALIERTTDGRAGLDTTRVLLRPGSADLAATDSLATATALADAAAAGQALVSPPTGRQLAAHFDLAPGGLVGGERALVLSHARPAASPTVTFRGRELARLLALAERCFTERKPRIVVVRAPAGFGKSRLQAALAARLAERRELDWLSATAAPLGETAPLALLRSANPDWFAAALAAGFADRDQAMAAARRWLSQRALRRPVAVAFEDVQWADQASRDLIASLRVGLDDVPVFVAIFERADDDRPAPSAPGVEVITLGPLDDADATALARQLAPSASDDAIALVVARAAGNPFFVEELARDAAERGGKSAAALPATVEAVVQTRLDRLPSAEREVIAAAAVVGRWFWREAVARALAHPLGDAELDGALAELEHRGLIAPASPAMVDDDRYRFAQAVTRDVAYGRLAPRDRRAAHVAVAAWLERTAASDDAEVLLAIAHHRDHGGDEAAAALAYRAAGTRCLELFAFGEAAGALRRAVALAPVVDGELAELFGDAVIEGASLDDAEAAYQRAIDQPNLGAARTARLWYKLGNVASRRGDGTRAVERFERGLALVGPWADADPRTPALLDGMLGWTLGYQLGANDRGLPHCERAVARLEGTPHRRDLAHALSRLGAAYMRAGRFHDQLRCNQRNLAIAEELGDIHMQLVANINLGVVLGVIGDLAGAIERTEAARVQCARTGSRTSAGLVASNLGGYWLELGELDRAQRWLDEGIAIAEQVGDRRILPEAFQFAARIRAGKGDLAGAARWAQQALAIAREQGSALDTGMIQRLCAQLAARTGDRATALAAIAESRALLGPIDDFEAARTDAAHARIAARFGYPEAAALRARARAVFERLGTARELAVLDDPDEVR